MPLEICGNRQCSKLLSHDENFPKCVICFQRFHRKCSLPISDLNDFHCSSCMELVFPFNNIETRDLFELFNENVFIDNMVSKKCKCAGCRKYIKKNNPAAHCYYCSNYFHLKCEKLSKPDFPLPSTWCCSLCILKNLPFSQIGDDNMNMTLYEMDHESINTLTDGAPSFSLKSLLDVIPG